MVQDPAPAAVVTIDCAGVVVGFGPEAERLLGYPHAEAVGRPIGDLIVPARLRQAHEAGLRRCVETGEGALLGTPFRMPALCRDGTEIQVELVVSRIRHAGAVAFEGRLREIHGPFAHDIELFLRAENCRVESARLRSAERRARIEYARLLTLVESLKVGVLLQDEQQRVVLNNSAFVEMFEPAQFTDPAAAGERADDTVRRGRPCFGDEVARVDGRMLERDYVPITLDGSTLGHLWVYRDVTAQTHVRRTLQEHNRILTEVSALKTEFVAVLSHELRTPLTSIATFAGMLDSTAEPAVHADPAEYRTAVAAIRRNADRMLSLVADLVLLARLESGEFALGTEPVALGALVRATAPKSARVSDGPPVSGDEELLRQLLDTVFGVVSGISAGVRVEATVSAAGWVIRLDADTTEPATTERLLSTRMPHPRYPDEYRTGALALMLARAIAARHGGALTTTVDVHTITITLTLPVANA